MSALDIKDGRDHLSSGAADPIDVLKLRVLLAFLNETPKVCTVTGFSIPPCLYSQHGGKENILKKFVLLLYHCWSLLRK